MNIYKIQVENLRLLKAFSMDLEEPLSLVVGKNNTGKTSILTVLDKFLNEQSKFSYDDFNIGFKSYLEHLIESKEIPDEFEDLGIKLKIFIQYTKDDDLSNVSSVLMDLDPDNNKIVLGFEYTVVYTDFLRMISDYQSFSLREKEKVEQKKKKEPCVLKDFLEQELASYFRIWKKSFYYDIVNHKVSENDYIDLDKEGVKI